MNHTAAGVCLFSFIFLLCSVFLKLFLFFLLVSCDFSPALAIVFLFFACGLEATFHIENVTFHFSKHIFIPFHLIPLHPVQSFVSTHCLSDLQWLQGQNNHYMVIICHLWAVMTRCLSAAAAQIGIDQVSVSILWPHRLFILHTAGKKGLTGYFCCEGHQVMRNKGRQRERQRHSFCICIYIFYNLYFVVSAHLQQSSLKGKKNTITAKYYRWISELRKTFQRCFIYKT